MVGGAGAAGIAEAWLYEKNVISSGKKSASIIAI